MLKQSYDFMDKKNVNDNIQQIQKEIKSIKTNINNKKANLTEEERKEQEERINKLNQDIESLKTIGTILNPPWAPMKLNGSSSDSHTDLADRFNGGKTKKKLRKRRRTRKVNKNIR